MNRAARSLHTLIVAHRLNRAIVVGHSIGGTMAIFFAERYPDDVTNVVSVEGGDPEAATQAQRDAAVAKAVAPFQGIPQNRLGAVLRQQQLQYTITAKSDVATVERLATRSTPRAIVAWMRAALTLDLTPGLSRIAVPFTVIIPFDPKIDPYVGFATAATKKHHYTGWAAHAPRSEVLLIEPARHFVMFDRPQEFQRALQTALSR